MRQLKTGLKKAPSHRLEAVSHFLRKSYWIDRQWESFTDEQRTEHVNEIRRIAALDPSEISEEDKASIGSHAQLLLDICGRNIAWMENAAAQLQNITPNQAA